MTIGRARARAFGLSLEWRAALWLTFKGYRIVTRNFLARGGEIDVVALAPDRWLGRGTICFVEVRGRAEHQSAHESVDEAKRRRIRHAARDFLGRNPQYRDWPRRFDILAAGRSGGLIHHRNAFDA